MNPQSKMRKSGTTAVGARLLALPLLAAMVLVLGLTAPAEAAPGGTGAPESEATLDRVMAGVSDGEISVQASEGALSPSDATVEHIESDEGVFTAVTVPFDGPYSLLSNLTVVFDDAGSISQYNEMLYYENDLGNFHLTQYTDGELVQDNDMGAPYLEDAELLTDIENSAPSDADCAHLEEPGIGTQSVGAVAACLAGGLGIGGVTAYLLAGACAGSCVGGVVPVCAACVGGYAAISSAGMGVVVGCFQLL